MNDATSTPNTAQPPPLPSETDQRIPPVRRFTPEQDARITAIGDKYLDVESGRVKWGLALAENPDWLEWMGVGENEGMKPVIDRYNYIRRVKAASKPAPKSRPTSRKAQNFSLGTRWETDELNAYFEAVLPFVDGRHVNFKEFLKTPVGAKLLKRHKKTDISSRFYYEKGKGKLSRLWGKIEGCGPRSKWVKEKRRISYALPAPPTEDPAPVAATSSTQPSTEVNFCPYCGHNLQAVMMADRIVRDR